MTINEQLLIEQIRAGLRAMDGVRRETLAMEAAAFKGVILINGAASIALLAFTGNVWSSDQTSSGVQSLSMAILYFAAGVVIGTTGTVVNYFIQYKIAARFFQDQTQVLELITRQLAGESTKEIEKRPVRYNAYLIVAASFVVLAIGLFCVGVWETYLAFTGSIL